MTNDPTKILTANKIQLIVGLGNPGPKYAATRHNVGYWLIEQLCEQYHATLSPELKFKGCVAAVTIGDIPCRILQPTTYMNHSGQAVLAAVNFYKISPQEILIVHDELDLPVGSARLKFDGGHGGHNGLRDIVALLGTKQFYRLRLGIGHPGDKDDVANYVLHPASNSDKAKILTAIEYSLSVIKDIVQGKPEKAMNTLHILAK